MGAKIIMASEQSTPFSVRRKRGSDRVETNGIQEAKIVDMFRATLAGTCHLQFEALKEIGFMHSFTPSPSGSAPFLQKP